MYAWNWAAFQVWAAVWLRWLFVGGGMGPTLRQGLDFAQVEAAMRLMQIKKKRRPALLAALREMEGAALEALAKTD